MPGSKSDYNENLVLNWALTTNTVTRPTSWTLALYTTMPNDAGSGSVEPSGGSYARQAASFSTATAGNVNLAATVTYPTPTASWGTVLGFGIYDQAGNLLYYSTFDTAKSVAIGATVSIANGPSGLTISED